MKFLELLLRAYVAVFALAGIVLLAPIVLAMLVFSIIWREHLPCYCMHPGMRCPVHN